MIVFLCVCNHCANVHTRSQNEPVFATSPSAHLLSIAPLPFQTLGEVRVVLGPTRPDDCVLVYASSIIASFSYVDRSGSYISSVVVFSISACVVGRGRTVREEPKQGGGRSGNRENGKMDVYLGFRPQADLTFCHQIPFFHQRYLCFHILIKRNMVLASLTRLGKVKCEF